MIGQSGNKLRNRTRTKRRNRAEDHSFYALSIETMVHWMGHCPLLAVYILLGFSRIYPVSAALPDLVVRISPAGLSPSNSLAVNRESDDASIEILAKRAQFGSRDRSLEGTLVRPPDYDFFLCERYRKTFNVDKNGKVDLVTLPPYQKPDEKNSTVMLVPRGECSFERKAYAAKHFYGAKAILIYDRLGARYTWNVTTNRVNFPQAILDYECGNGNAVMNDLPLDPPAYNESQLDPLMGFTTKMPTNQGTSVATASQGASPGQPSNPGFDVGMTRACDLTNTALNSCESQLCLVTSHRQNSTDYPVCCAWDTPVTMAKADDAKDLDTDDILAVWLTIRQSELVFQSDFLSFQHEVSIKTRGSSSAFNVTYIFMWMWGTLVMMVGAWYAAGEYRRFGSNLTAYKANKEKKQNNDRDLRRPRRKKFDQPNDQSLGREDDRARSKKKSANNKHRKQTDLERGELSFQDEMDDRIIGKEQQPANEKKQTIQANRKKSRKTIKNDEQVWSLRSLPPPERKRKQKRIPRDNNVQLGNNFTKNEANTEEGVGNESSIIPARESGTISPFEMTQWHVVGFIVMASLTLVVLYFYPKAYNIIFILYGLGCAAATSQLIFNPLFTTMIPKLGESWVEEFNKPVVCGCNGFSVTSHLFAYIWTVVWIWYGITHHRPETNAFFWITLNILGACLCILIVSVMKLNSIKIATILLVGIFFYDIFFVFITPFLTGGISVMLKVATGSENPNGADFCYKYPEDRFCKGIGFLPMLFIFPKANDYADGSVILGLGDIILPGFLIAFSARHDEAARLLGAHASFPDIKSPTKWYEGFFFPMLMAYSLGLFLAFVAVILMEQGQPALLYICPICLITILILGRREIKELWNGAKVFKLADGLITKTERNWGKTRMKEFAERLKRENDARATDSGNEPDPEQLTTRRSTEILAEKPRKSPTESSSDNAQPRSTDVCFGYDDHPGTKALRKVVQEVAAAHGEEEYKPEIYKIIRRKLKGRRFFMTNNIVWAEASKLETRKQIGKVYDRARGRRSTVLKDSDPLSVART